MVRPPTPPCALTRSNISWAPILNCTPSALAGPVKAADWPRTILLPAPRAQGGMASAATAAVPCRTASRRFMKSPKDGFSRRLVLLPFSAAQHKRDTQDSDQVSADVPQNGAPACAIVHG